MIRLTDHGFRDWDPELLHYSLDTSKFKPGALEMVGPEGKPVPFQVSPSSAGKGIRSFAGAVAEGMVSKVLLRPP